MNEQELQSEFLSADEEKLRGMCANLKRVSAPKNFDMRVKARIAAHQSQPVRSPFFGFLKVAAPLALLMVIFGVIVSTNLNSGNQMASSQVTASYAETAKLQANLPTREEIVPPSVARNSGPNANAEIETPRTANVNMDQALASRDNSSFGRIFGAPKTDPIDPNNGSSRDSASTTPRVIKSPVFNQLNPNVQTPSENNKADMTNIISFLKFYGINAISSGSSLKVQSIDSGSQAERSDILPNDIIEAINGVNVNEIKKISINNGTKLSVMRERNRIERTLK